MKLRKIAAATLTLIIAGFAAATGATEPAKALQLDQGAVTETGNIKGKQTVDYTLQARKGQTLNVKITTGDPYGYFDLLPPGGGEPLYRGTLSGQEFTGALPGDGEYTLHVHLAGRDAMHGGEANYTLTVSLDGK